MIMEQPSPMERLYVLSRVVGSSLMLYYQMFNYHFVPINSNVPTPCGFHAFGYIVHCFPVFCVWSGVVMVHFGARN